VRAAARLAASLKADWLAVYVETPKLQRLPDNERERALAALKLATELGAESVTLPGDDVATTLVAYARMRDVSRFVVGAPAAAPWWRRALRAPVGERIVRAATDMDVTLIHAATMRDAAARGERLPRFAGPGDESRRSPAANYAYALAVCAFVTLAASTLLGRIALVNLVMLFLLGAIFTAARLGRGPGVLYSFLGVAAFDFFFVPPRMSLSVSDTQYLLTFGVMLLTSLTISHLTWTLRHRAHLAVLRERRTGAMFAMTRDLGAALAAEQIIETGSRHVSETFQARTAILLPDSAQKVRQKVEHPDPQVTLDESALDLDIAQWVYDQQKPAGAGTETLPATAALYLPLKAPMRTRGVLAIQCAEMAELAVPEQRRMLDTFAAQIALAIERVHYVEIAQDALVNMESERLRNSLLAAISHDLRTPLTAMVGFASLLAKRESAAAAPDDTSRQLAQAIHDEALRMAGLVTNLLDMARLQGGRVKLNHQWSSLEELIGAALAGARPMLAGRKVSARAAPDLPLVNLDPMLVERVFANLLENVVKYTPQHSPVTIDATLVDGADGARRRMARVEVRDDGPGLPAGMEARVFDKFTRGEKESAKPGIGLGLAICRAIVEAHGGRIGAFNHTDVAGRVRGACFWFELPADEMPALDMEADEPNDQQGEA